MATTPVPKAPLSRGSPPKRGIMFLVLLLGITVTLFILNRTYEKRFSNISNHILMVYDDQRIQEYTMERIHREIDIMRSLEKKIDALRKDRTNDSSYLMLVKRSLEQSKKLIKTQENQIQDLLKQRKYDVMNSDHLIKHYKEQVKMLADQFTQEKAKVQVELDQIKVLYNQTAQELNSLRKLVEDLKLSSITSTKKEEIQVMKLSEDIRSLEILPSEKPETKVPRVLESRFKKKAELIPIPSEDQKKVSEVKEMEKSVANIPIQETSLAEKPQSVKEVVPVANKTSKIVERNYHNNRNVNTRKTNRQNELQEMNTKKDMVLHLEETHIAQNVPITANVSSMDNGSKMIESTPESIEKANAQRREVNSVGRQPMPRVQSKEEGNKPNTNTSQEVKRNEVDNKTLSKPQEKEAEKPSVKDNGLANSKGFNQNVISLLNTMISGAGLIRETSTIQGTEAMEVACKELEALFDDCLKKKVTMPKATMWKFRLVKKNLGWLKDKSMVPKENVTRKLEWNIRSYAYWLSYRAISLKESFEGKN